MSIIGQAAGAQDANWGEMLILWPLALAALALAHRAGVFRRGSIVGPRRVGDRDPLGLLAVLLGAGTMLWILLQVVLLMPARPVTAAPAPSTMTSAAGTAINTGSASQPATSPATLPASLDSSASPSPRPAAPAASQPATSPAKMALASSLPALAACAFLLLGNVYVRPGGLAGLGLSAADFKRGARAGLIGSVIATPLVFASAALTQHLWQALHYTHPKEHDLLRLMRDSGSPLIAAVLIASAVLIAPLFEEILFRGHLQTLITYALSRFRNSLMNDHQPPRGFEVVLPSRQGGDVDDVAAAAIEPPSFREPTQAARWASVLFTSLAFSIVHPAWTIPPIFMLSVCLGYAYERTGSLWTVITMHACFNLTSTVFYLLFMN